jgi:hypothetical protein
MTEPNSEQRLKTAIDNCEAAIDRLLSELKDGIDRHAKELTFKTATSKKLKLVAANYKKIAQQ